MPWRALFRTDDAGTTPGVVGFILRLTLAGVMLPHGLDKLGLLGGTSTFGSSLASLEQLGIPTALAAVAILTEVVAPLLLIVGLLGRLAALALGIEMTVAALLVHRPNGFFMNWLGQKSGEGFEFHILFVGAALGLLLLGSGGWSADRAIFERARQRRAVAPQAPAREKIASTRVR